MVIVWTEKKEAQKGNQRMGWNEKWTLAKRIKCVKG